MRLPGLWTDITCQHTAGLIDGSDRDRCLRVCFCVCVCARARDHIPLQTTLTAETGANTKHLRVSSEVCIGTHSSRDSFNLSRAKARFRYAPTHHHTPLRFTSRLQGEICGIISQPTNGAPGEKQGPLPLSALGTFS